MNNGKAVETYQCPVCKFPLDFHFVEVGFERKAIELHVGCSKCCWMENWGTYTIDTAMGVDVTPKGGNRVRLEPRSGTGSGTVAA